MCEQVAHTTLDLFVDYLQQALKGNAGMKLDAQELTFQSRQFKKEEKERYLNRTQKTSIRTGIGQTILTFISTERTP